jgi:hypothetical protein
MVDSTQYVDKNGNPSFQGKHIRNLGNKIWMYELIQVQTSKGT